MLNTELLNESKQIDEHIQVKNNAVFPLNEWVAKRKKERKRKLWWYVENFTWWINVRISGAWVAKHLTVDIVHWYAYTVCSRICKMPDSNKIIIFTGSYFLSFHSLVVFLSLFLFLCVTEPVVKLGKTGSQTVLQATRCVKVDENQPKQKC